MTNIELALQGGWKVLTASLAFGAGMPVVYALAMRALALGGEADSETDATQGSSTVGKLVAGLLLLVVLAGVAVGITIIVAAGIGKVVSFEHVIPTLIDKK